MPDAQHIPVLLNETLDLLNLSAGSHVIDGTLGLGGHAKAILECIGPKGHLLGIDRDKTNLTLARENLSAFKNQITLVHGNFADLECILERLETPNAKRPTPNAILLDLGLSSPHVDDPERGFSFRKEGPLDMRFNRTSGPTAADLINRLPENELARIFREYGEERQAKKIASRVVHARKKKRFVTTQDLVEVIPGPYGRSRLHPATRVFQALRVAVNQELTNLEKGLHQAIKLLKPGGRIAVISYHSLEDRIVKNIFRYYNKDCICPKELPICQCNFRKSLYLITKKPIIPSGIEVQKNPRSRSAKLRVAEKL